MTKEQEIALFDEDLELLDISNNKPKTTKTKEKNKKETKVENTDIDIILSYDKRVPYDVNPNYKFVPILQFIERANSEEGMLIDNNLYINLDVVTKYLYDALMCSPKEYTDRFIFYKFDDQIINLTFIDNDKVKIYKAKKCLYV